MISSIDSGESNPGETTTITRHFSHDIFEAIQLYTQVLQQVPSQFVLHPKRNLGCFNLLYVNGSKLDHDWDSFGSLWGWDHDAFTSLVKDVTIKRQELVSNEMKDEVVPPELMPLTRVHKDIFSRVNDVCYSSITLKEVTLDGSVQKERDIFRTTAVAVAAKT